MLLRALTNGAITTNTTIEVRSQIVGGVLITTDNTNPVAVKVQRDNSSGKAIIDITTDTTLWISGPFGMEGTEDAFVSISGTGGAVQIYEWVT